MATIKFKRGTSNRWIELNPILESGEPGFETDTGKLKIGNGTTPWNQLSYIESATGIEAVNIYADLPEVGDESIIYRVIDEKALYQYNVSEGYYELIGISNNIPALTPVDGSLIIDNGTIDIGISMQPGNALVKKTDGLYVDASVSGNYTAGSGLTLVDGTFSVKLANETHGLVVVDNALILNLATKFTDGAMSKEDKAFIDELKELNISSEYATKDEIDDIRDAITQIEQSCVWSEM